jgi:PASTA domain
LLGLLGLAGVLGVVSSGFAGTLGAAGPRGNPTDVPGSPTFHDGGVASVGSVSCATAGNCAAGGSYFDGSNHGQAFVVDEKTDSWGTAKEVPGTAALNRDGDAGMFSVSCATAGNCAGGGQYVDGSSHGQAFVVDEAGGSWGTAIEVPGTATLNSGHDAQVNSVSCAAAGTCTAGGSFRNGSGDHEAFVVDETSGNWGTAIEVPGSASLNVDGNAFVQSVSCATAGNCAAIGDYVDGSGSFQMFVVDETSGTWGTAIEIPGSATLNGGGYAQVNSVSCAAAGTCAAGGTYLAASGRFHSFVVDETSGSWGTAIEVPGSATLNAFSGVSGDPTTEVSSVSCATAGNCAASGYYTNGSDHRQAFVVDETSGSWGDAIEVPRTATLNRGGDAWMSSVSCATAGNCAGGGYYSVAPGNAQAFVVDEKSGSWVNAIGITSAFPCVVPKLVGKSLRTARKALAAAHCSVGKVKKSYAKAKKGRVVAQHPKPGTHLKYRAKVALTVSKGKK